MRFGKDEPPVIIVPDGGESLWSNFWTLRHTKESYESPIGFSDLAHFKQTLGECLSNRDSSILISMDYSFRKAAKEVAKEDKSLSERHKKK